jgi:hypothetical protein
LRCGSHFLCCASVHPSVSGSPAIRYAAGRIFSLWRDSRNQPFDTSAAAQSLYSQ